MASTATCKSTTEVLAPCADPVLLTVGAGTTPRFTWDPACGAYQLFVTDTAAANYWGVGSDSSRLRSGIDYGVTPSSDATQLVAPVALQQGKPYVVGLYRQYIGSPTQNDVIAAIRFVP